MDKLLVSYRIQNEKKKWIESVTVLVKKNYQVEWTAERGADATGDAGHQDGPQNIGIALCIDN